VSARVTDVTARIGVLGGTFDPPHLGHLVAAAEVCFALDLDQALLAPTSAQPLKPPPVATALQRWDMCRLAAAEDALLDVTDVDLSRGGTTYTVDTLRDLRDRMPDADLYFITGADALATLPRWKDSAVLPTLATFVGVTRAGHSFPKLDTPHRLVEIPALAVSSTDVRDRVRAGSPIRYLVPHAVAQYIAENGLYSGGMDE
jgi:nicotinate-nucleotide adenylyltransferase